MPFLGDSFCLMTHSGPSFLPTHCVLPIPPTSSSHITGVVVVTIGCTHRLKAHEQFYTWLQLQSTHALWASFEHWLPWRLCSKVAPPVHIHTHTQRHERTRQPLNMDCHPWISRWGSRMSIAAYGTNYSNNLQLFLDSPGNIWLIKWYC